MMQVLSPGRRFRLTVVSIWPKSLQSIFGKIFIGGAVSILTALSFNAHANGNVTGVVMSGISALELSADGAPIVVDDAGERHLVGLFGRKVTLTPAGPAKRDSVPEDAIPDAKVVISPTVDRAWLGAPTKRYGHGVLGDAIEAGALYLGRPDGPLLSLILDDDAVFEDRYPRFADMDGDGASEILLVKSYLKAGGALVLIDPKISPLSITAEAEAIGTPNRWLNPVGVGDVDGDGRPEALVVITPHIGGTLTAYEWNGDRLTIDHEIHGFSNHAIGSRELALSTVADIDGDGIPEAIVPDASRRSMTIVKFDGEGPRVVAKVTVRDQVTQRLVVHDLNDDGRPELIWGEADGTLVVWSPEF